MERSPIDSAGMGTASFRSYAIGFVLAIILTAISFALVMSGETSRSVALIGIYAAAVVQILVHLHYFLHLDMSSAARWNVMALIFTVLIMAFFIGGTIWIMYHLHYRLM